MQRQTAATSGEVPTARRSNESTAEPTAAAAGLIEGSGARAEGTAEDTDDERARLRHAVLEANEQVKAASRAKSEFLATMSHEMRTPLNAVLGYTELLALGVPGAVNDEQRSYLDRIRSASSRLLSLINDVLDLTKIDSGRMLVAREQVKAEPIVKRAVAMVAQQAAGCGVRIASTCASDPSFLGDKRRVEQVVLQLLANAIRFSPRGGTVSVSCTQFGTPEAAAAVGADHRCWCAIRVQDTGIGIDAQNISGIFDPFVQVESGHTRSYEGSGLGLAIGRRLARLMGGDLTVTSALGTGSAFTLWLPAPPVLSADGEAQSGCSTPERRTDSRHTHGLIELADAILVDLDGLVRRLTSRLRADPAIPAAALDDTHLEEHTATLLTDVAQSLCIIEESNGEPTQLMRDGSAIQTLIANRHGAHRQHLGWSEAHLDREFDLLLEEVARATDGVSSDTDAASLAAGRELIRGFLTRGREESRRAFRMATVGAPPDQPPRDSVR